jgi:hypothetical protein
MLDRLTVETFAPAVGSTFALHDGDADPLALTLIEGGTSFPDAPPADASGTRSPFSLRFLGPLDPILPQRIYRLEHDAVGPLEIFLVPVGRDASGTHYEAIFA